MRILIGGLSSCLLVIGFLTACSSTPVPPTSSAINSQPTFDEDPKKEGGCNTPLGFIPDGGAVKGFLRPVEQGGMSCQQGELTCTAGAWSGAYIYPSCVRQP